MNTSQDSGASVTTNDRVRLADVPRSHLYKTYGGFVGRAWEDPENYEPDTLVWDLGPPTVPGGSIPAYSAPLPTEPT